MMNKLTDDITNTLDSNKTFTHLSTIVKELIENSIDAKANQIQILIVDNGLSLMEIKDNGIGISKETFTNLCKRFSSSKIKTYSDLSSLDTFGFRGEALSILSYISTLTIISKDRLSEIGVEATYRNGKLVSPNMKNVPCEVGTCIKVENIFYNNSIRRKVYDKNKISEIEDIINVISKLAYHFVNISFILCKDSYMNKIIVTTAKGVDESPLDIRKKLGAKLFKQELNDELFVFDNKNDKNEGISEKNLKNINADFKFECYYTKPSANIQKRKLILFVNNRLVKNDLIQKLFDQTYSKFLIKKGNYFSYLSITCPPEMIDVNVAANKSKIFFLNEDILFTHFQNLLEEQLQEEINSKNYYVGSYKGFEDKDKEQLIYSKDKKNIYDKDKVRVDNNTISIERFISRKNINSKHKIVNEEKKDNNEIYKTIYDNIYIKEDNSEEKNEIINRIIKNNYFVGYDNVNSIIFLQYMTSLYIINAKYLLDEYFLYLILSNNSTYIETINIKKSSYTLSDIFRFINDNFPDKRKSLIKMRDKSEIIENAIKNNEINKYGNGLIEFDNVIIKKIKVINFFTNKDFINNFLSYIPLMHFSTLEVIFLQNENNNTNLNIILHIVKVYAHYLSNAYIEYVNKHNDEFYKNFFRDVILFNMQNDTSFYIRNKIKNENLCEKIIDTETLYTVFERC